MKRVCNVCGKTFDDDDARFDFNLHVSDFIYDDLYEGVCGDCAMDDFDSNANYGKAMLMVNGDEDYDQDFVDRWL